MITKTITFTNSGNEALFGYIADINLTATEFSFANKLSGNFINFVDNGVNLPYCVLKFNKANSLIRVFVSVNIPANSIKTVTLNTGVNSITGKRFSNLLLRKQPLSITKSFYQMNTVGDTMALGADMTLVNSSLITSARFGRVLDCNGVNGYSTIVRDYDSLSTYAMCGIGFNFALKYDHKSGSGVHTIYSKYVDVTHYISLYFANDGKLYVSVAGTNYVFGTSVFWSKFESHSVYIRINKQRVVVRIDNIETNIGYPTLPNIIGTGGQSFTFGAYNNGTASLFANCYIWDIEFNQGQLLIGDEFSRNMSVSKKGDSEIKKWEFICDVPDTEPDDVKRQEPNIIAVGTDLYLYCADVEVPHLSASVRISNNNGVTWSAAQEIIIDTYTSAIIRLFAFQDSGKIYIIYKRASDISPLYIVESTDGVHFTNEQLWFMQPEGYTMVDNSCVYYDTELSKWYGYVEGWRTGYGYTTLILSGDTLMGITLLYEALTTPAGYASGGFLKKINGIWHLWLHSSFAVSEIFRFKNSDITTDTWVRVYPNNPIFISNNKWAQSQVADISICEKDGICYAAVNNSGDAFHTTGNQSIFKYNGTLEQLVSDLSIAIT